MAETRGTMEGNHANCRNRQFVPGMFRLLVRRSNDVEGDEFIGIAVEVYVCGESEEYDAGVY